VIGAIGLALAFVGSGTSGASVEFVSPGATLDQNNPSRASACRYTGSAPDAPTDWAAQTFTAGVSGSLSEVVVRVKVLTALISVTIVPVGGGGEPVVATPLASTSPALPATTTYLDVEASFPTPARVEAGRQYAIVVSSPTGGWAWQGDVGSSVTDPWGTRCADGGYPGGRAWPVGADADFFFQTYVVPARHVTVDKIGTGIGSVRDSTGVIDCGATCSGEFLQAQTVTLTATPGAGSTFSSWSGSGCTGTAPTCSVAVNSDISVTAKFSKVLVSLTVHKSGRGTVRSVPAGIACGRRCSHSFVPGPVKLTATPSLGWRFARWQGACRDTRPLCRLGLLRARTVAAFFTRAGHGSS